jgi:23S rRNA (cytosine1962-C5)-methyltransferase
MSARISLKPGKEHLLQRRHPWLFSGALGQLEGRARPGDTVEIVSGETVLARAAYSPTSQIRARIWTFDPHETIDNAFFKRRIAAAVERRRQLPELRDQQGLRLIHAESDGLPGLIADQYGDMVVIQLTSTGADKWRKAIVDALVLATGCARVYERSDADVRKLEGLESVTGWVHGEAPNTDPVIDEHGVRMAVNYAGGHKTGFYLDQRDNRRLTRELAAGKRVLNCFCYTGGFSLQALAGGASEVISIDSSGPALETAQSNLELNPELMDKRNEWREGDVFDTLRDMQKAGEKFDLIILDPPKFAPTVSHVDRATRAYKEINLQGFKLLNPGGMMMTYSCSGGIGAELFQSIVASAARDAKVSARIVKHLQGAADHPVDLAFPEGEYLKGLLVQAD